MGEAVDKEQGLGNRNPSNIAINVDSQVLSSRELPRRDEMLAGDKVHNPAEDDGGADE